MRVSRIWFVALLAGVSIFVLVGCQQVSPVFDAVDRSMATSSIKSAAGATGFDEFGYNYKARVFIGPADGVDRVLDGKVWGDPTYAKDHLVMKWSKGWDDARFHGAAWSTDAWENNERNGMVEGGSGEVWHDKIIWVGPQGQDSPYWREGGSLLWGQFEEILSQGVVGGSHEWLIHATPSGYGTNQECSRPRRSSGGGGSSGNLLADRASRGPAPQRRFRRLSRFRLSAITSRSTARYPRSGQLIAPGTLTAALR